MAKEYLKYLYSDEGQEIAAKNFYRPRNEAIAKKYAANFTDLKLVTLDEEFGSWAKAQQTHFADGGVFDQSSNRKTRLRFLRRGGGLGTPDRRLSQNQTNKNMTIIESPARPALQTPRQRRRSIAELLAPLEEIAAHSPNLVANHDARFEVNGAAYDLPRYLFVGPRGGDTPIRVGIFAGVHGDEPEGVHALVQFIKLLESKPELAAGYYLSFYPICNPSGFEDGTRVSRSGKDLNREFWKDSAEPEVRLLQAELQSRSFQGIISLHTDDTSSGFYGIVRGATLTKH